MLTFNPEQLRVLANLNQHYDSWLAAARGLDEGRLYWKAIGGREYLYRVSARRGIDTSLGPRDAGTEARYAGYEVLRATHKESGATLRTDGALYRALKLPMVAPFAGDVLRELDLRRMLGTGMLVVGTVALAAYEIEAGQRLPAGFDATDDFDLAWAHPVFGGPQPEPPNALLDVLKSIDATYTLNTEREFQIRNAKGNEVELVLPASLSNDWAPQQRLRPIPLPEQDWLLFGDQVSHVVCDLEGKAARLVVPDPRWFGLHKLWLSRKPGRNVLKVTKDLGQGLALLDLTATRMPRFPFDRAFEERLPAELRSHYDFWRSRRR